LPAKISFCQNIFFITVKCCYTVYNVLTDDWYTDNDSTAAKQTDVNDGATMQPQDSVHLRLSLSDNHNDSETLTDYVTV